MNKKGKIGASIAAGAAMIACVCIGGCNDKSKSMPVHEHTYCESEWSQDDVGHWHSATCGHGVRKDYGKHIYDGDADADCNVCGRIREIQENKDPADSNVEEPEKDEGEPDVEPAGFIIGAETDALIVEGISGTYSLSEEFKALDFNDLPYAVYLSESGRKGKEVPPENYETKVYYGGKEVGNAQKLTSDGEYYATLTLVGAYYENGESVVGNGFFASVNFTIENAVGSIKLIGGKTEQVKSLKDKMSGGWLFEAVRANGDKETVVAGEVELLPPDTETVGTRKTTVKYGGAESEIEYTVKPVPEIVSGGVKITSRLEPDIQTDEEYVRIGIEDFGVEYSVVAGYAYSVGTVLIFEGGAVESARLKADGITRRVAVRVEFVYEVEGEKIFREYREDFEFTVSKKPEEPNAPTTLDGADIAGGVGEVRAEEQTDFIAAVNGAALEIKYAGEEDAGVFYSGLKIYLDKAATVKIRLTVSDGALAGIMQDGGFGDGQMVDGETELTFEFSEGGVYETYISLNNPSDAIIIHGAEIIY